MFVNRAVFDVKPITCLSAIRYSSTAQYSKGIQYSKTFLYSKTICCSKNVRYYKNIGFKFDLKWKFTIRTPLAIFLFQTLTVTAFPTTEVDQVPSRHRISSKYNFNYLCTCAASSELLTSQGKPSVLSKLNNIWQMPLPTYLFISFHGLHWTNLVMITDRFLSFHLL